jgi:hypothetical protein
MKPAAPVTSTLKAATIVGDPLPQAPLRAARPDGLAAAKML